MILLFLFSQLPLLEAGDIIIDGGNSEYKDSNVSIIIAAFSGLKLTCFLFLFFLSQLIYLREIHNLYFSLSLIQPSCDSVNSHCI